jgi:FtsP/CotA-like multicopper oxidase with cupredoxin domain
LVNNQFPGPTIEANWGDWIEVTVTNNIPDEGTAIHWHGLLQKQTPYMDGIPGNNQCPIAPGKTFTYRFQAGTSSTDHGCVNQSIKFRQLHAYAYELQICMDLAGIILIGARNIQVACMAQS